jgi:hypothetical protein
VSARASATISILLLVMAAGCTHRGEVLADHAVSERRADDLRKTVDCGTTPDGAHRWQMLVYRADGFSYLYFEKQSRKDDGRWVTIGGAGFDPSSPFPPEKDRVPRRLQQLRCSVDGGGVRAHTYANADNWRRSYHAEIQVLADFTVKLDLVILAA